MVIGPRAQWLRRVLLLAVAGGALAAVLGGLGRLGFDMPGAEWAMDHGPLFVLGVFQTVVGLERAVALGKPWGYGAPILGGIGAIGMVASFTLAPWLSVGAGGWLVLVNCAIVHRQTAAFTWLMLLGSVVLWGGSLTWALGRPVFEVVSSWLAFFVLTIIAERLELSRLAPTPPWAPRLLIVLALLYAAASVSACLAIPLAPQVMGALLVALACWQLRFDLARRTLRRSGLPRFAALGVLLGTSWLLVAGTLLAFHGLPRAGPFYDAILHAVFVGFVLSMVFAHAPIILPAVARIDLPFHTSLYVPLIALHGGLIARVLGDVLEAVEVRRIGGLANALSLALFAGTAFVARHFGSVRSETARSVTSSPETAERPQRMGSGPGAH